MFIFEQNTAYEMRISDWSLDVCSSDLLKDVLMFDSLCEHSAAVLPYMAVGFGAQMVDGALGMAFGVISNTLLLTLGVPPAAASAGVRSDELRVGKEWV